MLIGGYKADSAVDRRRDERDKEEKALSFLCLPSDKSVDQI